MTTQPACVGTYEAGHPTCDGVPGAGTWQEQTPCAWRDRCVGLRHFCADGGHVAASVVATLGNGLVSLCETQIERLEIVNGTTKKQRVQPPVPAPVVQATATPKIEQQPKQNVELEKALAKVAAVAERVKNPVSQRQRRKAGMPATQQAPAPAPAKLEACVAANAEAAKIVMARHPKPIQMVLPDAKGLLALFETRLRVCFPDHAFGHPKRVVVRPGTFYAVDRLEGSRYIRWYCASGKGRDRAVACLRLKARSGTLDVALAVTPASLAANVNTNLAILRPVPIKDGQFATLCHGVGADEVVAICDALRSMQASGTLKLPIHIST